MLRLRLSILAIAALAAAAAGAQQRSLGVFGEWGAFAEAGRCYAIAQPHATNIVGTRPFASIANWPGQNVRGQLHIRLSGQQRQGSAVLIRIDGRTFQLVGRGWDAWAPDGRADAQLAAAIRTGLAMVVESRAQGGRLIRDHYRLRGAATAMDAAALACAPR